MLIHALSVWPIEPSSTPIPALTPMFLVHGIIFAANAVGLSVLPPVEPVKPCTRGSKIVLLVINLGVPAPASFPDLLNFIYTKNYQVLFLSLLPTLPPSLSLNTRGEQASRAFARKPAGACTSQEVLDATTRTFGMWRNACYMGVHDNAFWAVLGIVLEILLQAIIITRGPPAVRRTSL
jgi:hypothetical protein